MASGGPYNNGATDYMESFCLEDGSYTFTLLDSAEDGICCGYGEGDYSLIVEGQTIVDGQGEFGRSEVTPFTIGVEAPTTTTSTSSTTTTTTTTEDENCVNFVFDLKTDDYPGETTWKIKKDGQVVARGGPYNDGATDYFEELCLSEGSYTFILLDSAEDGICCGYGEGDYSLIVEGQTIVDGQGEFGRREATAFTIG